MGNGIIDAYLEMYLLALGEFDFDGFKNGPNRFGAWTFFIFATFTLLIVFMNAVKSHWVSL